MFNRVVQKLDHWLGRTSLFLMLLSGIMILLMAWGETYGVVKRYAFHAPDPFAYELSTMLLLFCGVLAVAGVERLDRHDRNDLVASRFPQSMKFIALRVIFPLLALLFVAVLTWKSLGDAMYALDIGKVSQSTWRLPLAPVKFVIPFGYILLCLVLIGKFCQGIALLRGSKYRDQIE